MKVLVLITLTALSGCQSIDWNQRIGTYTYNEALTEQGPPTKSIKMDDGSSIHGWNRFHRIPPWMDELILGFDRNGRLISGQEKRYYSRTDARDSSDKPVRYGDSERLKKLNRKIEELTGELNELRREMEAERFRNRND